MRTVHKPAIIQKLFARKPGCSKEVIKTVFTDFLDIIRIELKKGNAVSLFSLGKFTPKKYNRTKFMCPQTGTTFIKNPRIRIYFKEKQSLINFLNKEGRKGIIK